MFFGYLFDFRLKVTFQMTDIWDGLYLWFGIRSRIEMDVLWHWLFLDVTIRRRQEATGRCWLCACVNFWWGWANVTMRLHFRILYAVSLLAGLRTSTTSLLLRKQKLKHNTSRSDVAGKSIRPAIIGTGIRAVLYIASYFFADSLPWQPDRTVTLLLCASFDVRLRPKCGATWALA